MRWIGTSLSVLLAVCPSLAAAAAPAERPVAVSLLSAAAPAATAELVSGGAMDAYFEPLPDPGVEPPGAYWLELRLTETDASAQLPVFVIRGARQTRIEPFAAGRPVPLSATLPAFRGLLDRVYAVPRGASAVYVHIDAGGGEARGVSVFAATLDAVLERGAAHARMIALTVGGMASMAVAALLIWFVMADELFVLYAIFFLLEALYIAYLSGQGFEWPLLAYARPLGSFAWNVPVSLAGAVACLFAREIADLRKFAPRTYRVFGGFAAVFLLLTVANIAKLFGFAALVSGLGNLIFSVVAVFTCVVAFWSWRRGNRSAGWFLIAWGLLEGVTIVAALRFLFGARGDGDALHYYVLPLAMLAAAILIALGVADRLRQQRAALSDAERRAQTDPLTGVLNRRSLLERLDAACLRAQARGLPIAVLFIDLDHFKLINDSFGHQAGDDCLRAIVAPIHMELRQSDVIGRYGGEEFVVVLSSADAAAARLIALRILERIAEVRVNGFGEPIGMTCSIGVAASDTSSAWGAQLINLADAAVYAAKRLGRNQVQVASIPTA